MSVMGVKIVNNTMVATAMVAARVQRTMVVTFGGAVEYQVAGVSG